MLYYCYGNLLCREKGHNLFANVKALLNTKRIAQLIKSGSSDP